MRSRLYVPLQEVHPILIEITNRINKYKKRALKALFYCALSIKRKLNHRKQDILVHPGLHHRIVPRHLGHAYHLDDDPYILQVL